MSTVNVVSPTSEEAGTAELPDAIFAATDRKSVV